MKDFAIIGVGAIGGLHLDSAIRMFKAGILDRIFVVSTNQKLKGGDLRGRPQSNNFNITVPDAIEPDVLRDIKFFDTIEELIANGEFTNAIISSPTSTHFNYASRLAIHSKNVLIEKPACFSLNEAITLRRIASSNKIAVAHEVPYFDEYYALTQAHANGDFKNMKLLKLSRHVFLQTQINDPKQSGLYISAFVDLVVHDLHFILSLGYCPISVKIIYVDRHPNDENFISRVRFQLLLEENPLIEIDAGAIDMEEPFKAGFEAFSSVDRLREFSERIESGAIHYSESDTKTPLQEAFKQPAITGFTPICDFITREQLRFLSYVEGSTDSGPLDLRLGVAAIELALKIQNLARDKSRLGIVTPIADIN